MKIEAKPTLTPHQQAMREEILASSEAQVPMILDIVNMLSTAFAQAIHMACVETDMRNGSVVMTRVLLVNALLRMSNETAARALHEKLPDAAAVVQDLIADLPARFHLYVRQEEVSDD